MNKKIFLYIAVFLILIVILVFTFFPEIIKAWKDSGKSGGDICKPGSGYTEESWREHMGHHPDIYKDCLS